MGHTKKVNEDNFMTLVLGAVTEQDVNPDIRRSEEQLKQDADQAERVVADILKVFDKHKVSPMNGYLIAGALSDAIYSLLLDSTEPQMP